MKLFFSEFAPIYEQYAFPYQVWALEDSIEERELLLSKGFLPSRMKIGLWYLARSTRVMLERFTENSENRRIRKNTSDYHYAMIASEQFDVVPHLPWIQEMLDERVGEGLFSESAIKRMFSPYLSSNIVVWKNAEDETPIGLIPLLVTYGSVFYWMAFYKGDVSGFGTRMMLEAIDWSKQNDYQKVYLGTLYTESSLYKTNFEGFEFFNGFEWRSNIEELKFLLHRESKDELLKDTEYQKQFYEGKDSETLIDILTRHAGAQR